MAERSGERDVHSGAAPLQQRQTRLSAGSRWAMAVAGLVFALGRFGVRATLLLYALLVSAFGVLWVSTRGLVGRRLENGESYPVSVQAGILLIIAAAVGVTFYVRKRMGW